MASYQGIAVVSQALCTLLTQQLQLTFGANTRCMLSGLNKKDLPSHEGLALLLYRVTLNGNMRQRAMRPGSDQARALPVDLHYLLAACGAKVDRQHELLGWAMRFLDEEPTLGASVLNELGGAAAAFRDEESIELVCAPPELAEYLQLWDKVKEELPLSVGYIARTVLLERSAAPLGPAVRTRVFEAGSR
jgi:Pvc16 N-terminal domain